MRSLQPDPRLVEAGRYQRVVGASLERVWENVRDWEHLPWLHAGTFRSVDLIDEGPWGWHARVGMGMGGRSYELELCIDLDEQRYVTRTLSRGGAAAEVWTRLQAVADQRTAVDVRFLVPPAEPAALEKRRDLYGSLYARLWDEDEVMMRHRERVLAGLRERPPLREERTRTLGPIEQVRSTLPLRVEYAGREYRIVELDGALWAHATACPHRLGPLDQCPPTGGVLTCPWHGYRFDLRSGESCDGRRLKLPPAPRVEIDAESGEVRLAPAESGGRAAIGL